MFTSKFPDFTFGLHYFFWDNSMKQTYFVKGETVVGEDFVNHETHPMKHGCMFIHMNPDSVSLDNDITYIFGSEYRPNYKK